MNRLTRKIETLCKRISTHLPTEENKFQIYLEKIEKYKRYSSLQLECKYLDTKSRLNYQRMTFPVHILISLLLILCVWKWTIRIITKLLVSVSDTVSLSALLLCSATGITVVIALIFHENGKQFYSLIYEKEFLEIELHKKE